MATAHAGHDGIHLVQLGARQLRLIGDGVDPGRQPVAWHAGRHDDPRACEPGQHGIDRLPDPVLADDHHLRPVVGDPLREPRDELGVPAGTRPAPR